MISNNIPRKISSDQKRDFFFRTVGPLLIILCIYLIILICFIFFGRKDNLSDNVVIFIVMGIFALSYILYEYVNYKKNVYLAENGTLIEAQIVHINNFSLGWKKLTYTYQVNEKVYTNIFKFKLTHHTLLKVGNSLDIFYDDKKPDKACVACHVLSMEYEQGTPDKDFNQFTLIMGIISIGFSIFEHFNISSLEQKSVDGYIELNLIEGMAYKLFGKVGVTVFFASVGLFFILSYFINKKRTMSRPK